MKLLVRRKKNQHTSIVTEIGLKAYACYCKLKDTFTFDYFQM